MSQTFPSTPGRFDRAHRIPTRWLLPTALIACTKCGEEWTHGDPALQHDCTDCSASAGHPCVRPTGGNEHVCAGRDREAEWAGTLSECPLLSWTGRHSKPGRFVCDGIAPAGALPVRTSSPAPRWAV